MVGSGFTSSRDTEPAHLNAPRIHLVDAAERAGSEPALRLAAGIDDWVSGIGRQKADGQRVAWTIVSDPALSRQRSGFAATWPAFARLMLRPDCLASIDAGGETVPVIADFLQVPHAIARRLVGLPVLPQSVVKGITNSRVDPVAIGRYLAGFGHDRLPAAGDQANVRAAPGKGPYGGATHTGGRARNNYDLRAGAYLPIIGPPQLRLA